MTFVLAAVTVALAPALPSASTSASTSTLALDRSLGLIALGLSAPPFHFHLPTRLPATRLPTRLPTTRHGGGRAGRGGA